jgi:hypothetical protein
LGTFKGEKIMAKPLYAISLDVKVGIYDAEYFARVYGDKIVLLSPYVKWIGSSGSYAEKQVTIESEKVVQGVIDALSKGEENHAWNIIGDYVDDEYLFHVGR